MSRPIVIAAGTVMGGLLLFIGILHLPGVKPKEPWDSIGFLCSFVVAGVLTALATRRMAKSSKPTENLTIEQMEQQGLLVREKYEATRAFQVEEFEDEGCQYFIELTNGSVLFLCGQYLYDYEPMEGARTQARKFPCTEFTVLRDKRDGLIVDVVCGGTVIEPEGEAPHFTEADFESGRTPADSDIISNRTFDQLKHEWMRRR